MEQTVLLLIVTGLPGSGKSSFLRQLASVRSEVFKIVSVLRLDEFLTDAPRFDPANWQRAKAELRSAVSNTLVACLDCKTEAGAQWTNVVCVEDVMHYRSMRRSYWSLARELSASGEHGEAAVVLMAECRFGLPLNVCLERNEQRAGTQAHIPAVTIRSLHRLFEESVEHCAGKEGNWCECVASPWLLYGARGKDVPADVLAHEFMQLLEGEAGRETLKLQRQRRLRSHTENTLKETPCATSPAHHFDLLLRHCVAGFIESRRTLSDKDKKALSALKKKHLLQFKAAMKENTHNAKDTASIAETLSDQFLYESSLLV